MDLASSPTEQRLTSRCLLGIPRDVPSASDSGAKGIEPILELIERLVSNSVLIRILIVFVGFKAVDVTMAVHA